MPSADPSHAVASRGDKPSLPSYDASANGSITLLATKNTPFEATMAGLRFGGSESAATTSRPPFAGSADQVARGKASNAAPLADPARSARRDSR